MIFKCVIKLKYLSLVSEQKFYGCIQLSECISNYPKPKTQVEIYIGNNHINFVYEEVGIFKKNPKIN